MILHKWGARHDFCEVWPGQVDLAFYCKPDESLVSRVVVGKAYVKMSDTACLAFTLISDLIW